MAKSASDNFDFARLSRTDWLPASERFTSDGSGNELNSVTKLTETSYQKSAGKVEASLALRSRKPNCGTIGEI
jgi:hypothetical protein